MASKFSINDKTYTLPESDGYIPVGAKASVGNPATPVYMINGKLQPITSYSGNAYTATKIKGEKIPDNGGTFYLTSVLNPETGNKDLKIATELSVTTDGQNLAYLNIGKVDKGQGVLRLREGKNIASIFSDGLTQNREYTLPNKDGEIAIVTNGNDYGEWRQAKGAINPGQVVKEVGDGSLELATERLTKGCEIVSDTFSFAIGEAREDKVVTAVAGRVLAYPDANPSTFQIGAPVCAGANGTVSQMTEEEERLYPSRILGTVSEIPTYDIWDENVEVDGRIWIRVR